MYAPLWCKSNGSFLAGASHPEELVEQARELGLGALALTDRDGVYGAVRAHAKARELGVHLIHGAQVSIDDGSQVVLLVEDRAGWASLCRLLTAGRLRCAKGESRVTWDEVRAHAAGLVCLWGGAGSALAAEPEPEELAGPLRDAFADRLYALVCRHRHAEEVDLEARTRARAARFGLPVLAGREVLYHHRARRPLHDVLTCIRHGVTLATAGRLLRGNAEHDLLAPHGFTALWADDPAAVGRSADIAARCRFSLDRLAYRFPHVQPPPGETQFSHLHRLVHAGAPRRYRPLTPAAARQLARELDLIERLDLAGYFLLVHDIVRFCEEHEILCQGRGSAANSAVCYVLGITSVDPVGMDLLFERFLSENRGEMPDIDLDIEHERREEVLQYVYGKYGRDHAALAAEVISYRARSAVRDAGKALGFTLAEVDSLAKGLDRRWDNDSGALPPEWTERRDDPRLPHLLRLVQRMEGLPRHLSIHVGGMIITGPPLTDVMPVEPAAMKDRTVVPWDKDDLAALGILKIDLLGLGMLTALAKCFRLVNGLRREGE
ncbi:MAG TPA: PHP domain-containing protein, partial [Planctomycetota bacterium]|nr:PHP domain-containing protein [Planctomycetota bacterium]